MLIETKIWLEFNKKILKWKKAILFKRIKHLSEQFLCAGLIYKRICLRLKNKFNLSLEEWHVSENISKPAHLKYFLKREMEFENRHVFVVNGR